MTITHEPAHIPINRPAEHRRPRPRVPTEQPQVDVYLPRRDIRIDTMFWQHRSIFAGTQEQLDELRRDADERAAARSRAMLADYLETERANTERSVLAAHRPAIRRLRAVIHVGFLPLLWAITTCKCGDRWPCNGIKQHLRRQWGWTVDISDHLKTLTEQLPKPSTRWSRLRRLVSRRPGSGPGAGPVT